MLCGWLYRWAKKRLPAAERRRRSTYQVHPFVEVLETRCVLDCTGYFLEGQPFTTELDLFSKANRTASDFDTSINWEDGSNSPGTVVDAGNGNFEVIGTHTYQEEAEYEYIITFHDKVDGSTWQYGQGRLSLFVQDAPVLVSGAIFSVPANGTYNGPVGTVTDIDPGSTPADFTPTIDWGDGTSSPGTLVGGNGQFTLMGSHQFTGSPGQVDNNITVSVYTVEEPGDPYTPFLPWSSRYVTSASSSAELMAPGSPEYLTTMQGSMLSVPDGQSFSGDLFNINTNDPAAPGDVFAVQTGEDTTAGPITGMGGDVFAAQGMVDGMKTCFTPIDGFISDPRGGRASGQDWFDRQDLDLAPATIQAVEGAPVGSQVVAHLNNANAQHTYVATVTWGNNETSTGSVAADGTITATKPAPFAEEGTILFTVSVEDATASTSANVVSKAQVSDAPLTITSLTPPLNPVEGSSTGLITVATFRDQDPQATATDYTATISWGDDQTSMATAANGGIVDNHDGTFSVQGNHTYTEERSGATFRVQVQDNPASDTQSTSITIHDALLQATGVDQKQNWPGNQEEPTIAVDPTNSARLFLAANNPGAMGMFSAYSTDGGASWHYHTVGNGSDGLPIGYADPFAAFDRFGNLFFSYLTRGANPGDDAGGSLVILMSTDGGQTFQAQPVFDYAPPNGSGLGVDRPSLAVGPAGATGQDTSLWVTFLQDSPTKTPPFDVLAAGARITGPGQVGAFGANELVSGNGTLPNTNHTPLGGYTPSIAIGPIGQVMVSFLGFRPADGEASILTNVDPDGLGTAQSFSATPTFVALDTIGNNYSFDALPGAPPSPKRGIDAGAKLAWDRTTNGSAGRVFLSFVHAGDPINHPDPTDIYLVGSDDQGNTWTALGPQPMQVSSAVPSSKFFPSIAVDPVTGNLALTWYDTRHDPANVAVQVFATVSSNHGRSFSTDFLVSPNISNGTASPLQVPFGDYEGLAYFNGVLYPAWADNSLPVGGFSTQFHIVTTTVGSVRTFASESLIRQVAQFTDLGGAEPAANYRVSIDWGDSTPLDTTSGFVRLVQGNLFNVFGQHAYTATGTYGIHVTITDEGGSMATASATATVTIDPTPPGTNVAPPVTPPAPPPPPPAFTAVLVSKKHGKKSQLFIDLLLGGRLLREELSPFQKPTYQGIQVTPHDTNGDGIPDEVILTAQKGKKTVRRTYSG